MKKRDLRHIDKIKNKNVDFERFLCIHIIMLSLEGVPAFYIHSLFGTKNDLNLYAKTNKKRDLNRHVFEINSLKEIIKRVNIAENMPT